MQWTITLQDEFCINSQKWKVIFVVVTLIHVLKILFMSDIKTSFHPRSSARMKTMWGFSVTGNFDFTNFFLASPPYRRHKKEITNVFIVLPILFSHRTNQQSNQSLAVSKVSHTVSIGFRTVLRRRQSYLTSWWFRPRRLAVCWKLAATTLIAPPYC